MTAVVIGLTIAVAILAVLVLGLLRSHALILRRLHESGLDLGIAPTTDPASATPPAPSSVRGGEADVLRPSDARAGRRAHDVVGVDPGGGSVGIATTDVDHDTLLLFLSADCATCQHFWQALAPDAPAVRLPERTRIVVVTKGPEHESPPAIAERPTDVPVVMSDEAWAAFDVPGSPYAVHVDGARGRVVGEGTGGSWEAVADLLARATGELGYVAGPGRRKARRDRIAEQDTDAVLLAAGILPDDPSLYATRDES